MTIVKMIKISWADSGKKNMTKNINDMDEIDLR